MAVVVNIFAAICLYLIQGLLTPIIGLFTVAAVILMPIHLLQRGMETTEEYAAQHPWRVHIVSWWFTTSKVLTVLVEWALILWLLAWADRTFSILNGMLLFIESFLIFLSALNNARNDGKSQWNSLSYRLKGGTSEFRYRHGNRASEPDKLLGPIAVRRHWW